MGYDCTLHVIDPREVHEGYCKALLDADSAAPTPFDDATWQLLKNAIAEPADAATAPLLAQGAIQFTDARQPARYERGFCLSLWAWRMEDDRMVAEVPSKHRGDTADLDDLFAPLVAAHPELKGSWPTDLNGNGSTGIYVPAAKVTGLLKWVRARVKRYPKADHALFRGLILILEECLKRGLAYWEASDVAGATHPIESPESQRPAWVKVQKFPKRGSWSMVANVAPPTEPPVVIFHFDGDDNFLVAEPFSALFDFRSWPPTWSTISQAIGVCDRSRSGTWIVEAKYEPDVTWRSAGRSVEFRPKFDQRSSPLTIPMTEGARNYLRWQAAPDEPSPGATPSIGFVGMLRELPILLPDVGNLPPLLGGPGGDAPVPPHRPYVWRNSAWIEATELPVSTTKFSSASLHRLRDGSDVLAWNGAGYELRGGRMQATFELVPSGHRPLTRDDIAPLGEDLILTTSLAEGERELSLFVAQRGRPPAPCALSLKNLWHLRAGPHGGVVARQAGSRPKHLGAIIWPTVGTGGTVLWIDNDLFPDEDPDNILDFLWAEESQTLVAITHERLWSADAAHVLSLPRYDATTGRRLQKPKI